MFRSSAAARRCLVPADAFYEWKKTETGNQPYAIARQDGAPMFFAGLWDGWRGPDGQVIRSYAIITCPANETMAPIHDRMPVILEADDWPVWLGEGGDSLPFMRPSGASILKRWPVNKEVNSVRNNCLRLMERIS
jgi:putative SOS response-associated peptidase YedK